MAKLSRIKIFTLFLMASTCRGWTSPLTGRGSLTALKALSRQQPQVKDSLFIDKRFGSSAPLLSYLQESTLDRSALSAVIVQGYDETPTTSDEKYNKEKVVMLGLLWTIATLSSLDRVAMSVALVPMAEEFGFTDSVKGEISSLLSVGYGMFIIPSGLAVASASPRLVMGGGIFIWCLATFATPSLADLDSLVPLLIARACVGAAESCISPTIQRLLTTWTKPEEKSVALAAIFSGFQSGSIAAYLVSPMVMDFFGNWRYLFIVYGCLGLGILLPWVAFARDGPNEPQTKKQVQTKPCHFNEAEKGSTNSNSAFDMWRDAPWKDMLNSKASWGMLLAHCSKNWGFYITMAWTPTFYFEQYGIGVRDSALLSVLPSITGAVAGLLAGNIADYAIRNMKERTDEALTSVRKIFQGIALYVPALSLAILASNIPEDPQVAQFFLMATLGFQAFTVAGYEAGLQEKAGKKWAGLLYSVTSLPAVIFGTFGVWCVGQILDMNNQDWSVVFNLNAFVNVLGATAFLFLYNSKKEFE